MYQTLSLTYSVFPSPAASPTPTAHGLHRQTTAAAARAPTALPCAAEFLATAAAMAGDDVEDALVAVKKDAEEVPTRDRIKKALPPAAEPAKGKKAGGK